MLGDTVCIMHAVVFHGPALSTLTHCCWHVDQLPPSPTACSTFVGPAEPTLIGSHYGHCHKIDFLVGGSWGTWVFGSSPRRQMPASQLILSPGMENRTPGIDARSRPVWNQTAPQQIANVISFKKLSLQKKIVPDGSNKSTCAQT